MKWRRILILILLAVFLFSSYKIFSYLYEGWKTRSTYDEMRKLYEESLILEEQTRKQEETPSGQNSPRANSSGGIMERYKALLEINPDVVGWVRVPNTVIDYPVVQAQDNDYYLRRDIYGNYASAGAIFMDYRSDAQGRGRHIILYGHHMKNGTMFKELDKYKKKEFFDENNFVRFDSLFSEMKWEVFSVYVTETDFPYIQTDINSDEEYIAFLRMIKNRSMHQKDIELMQEDQILTLSTCSYEYDDARLVVHARRVRE
ncbi:MAG: class B sortase [Clostridiales bacterium]|nr:class B sortase [Clostridiales bacterium]